MDKNRKLSAVDWHSGLHPERRGPARRSGLFSITPTFWGVLGTVLLHALAMQVVLGTSARVKMRTPEHPVIGASSLSEGEVSELTLVVVQSTQSVQPTEDLMDEIASLGSAPKELQIALLAPEAAPAYQVPDQDHEDQNAESVIATGDPAGKAKLFGIYSAQVQARIERAWRRPRTPINGTHEIRQDHAIADFHCQVRILQDDKGNVTETLLTHCNGSAEWQKSLVTAINQSSPLPAPPSPTVFTNALSLAFTGKEYTKESSPDDYAIEAATVSAQQFAPPLLRPTQTTPPSVGASAVKGTRPMR